MTLKITIPWLLILFITLPLKKEQNEPLHCGVSFSRAKTVTFAASLICGGWFCSVHWLVPLLSSPKVSLFITGFLLRPYTSLQPSTARTKQCSNLIFLIGHWEGLVTPVTMSVCKIISYCTLLCSRPLFALPLVSIP